MLYKGRVELLYKDNGVNLRHTHGEEKRDIRISYETHGRKMMPSQRRSNQAKNTPQKKQEQYRILDI